MSTSTNNDGTTETTFLARFIYILSAILIWVFVIYDILTLFFLPLLDVFYTRQELEHLHQSYLAKTGSYAPFKVFIYRDIAFVHTAVLVGLFLFYKSCNAIYFLVLGKKYKDKDSEILAVAKGNFNWIFFWAIFNFFIIWVMYYI